MEFGISVAESIGALYSSMGGDLWRAMLAASGGRVDVADEATAEAFHRLCLHWDRVREPRPWLYRTAYRLVVEELRRGRRERPVQAAGDAHGRSSEDGGLSDDLTAALRRLEPDQRLAIFLVYFADLPLAEVATLTGSTAVAVRIRVHRARKRLREMIEETPIA
jgi:RNA polymerase sigma factor (sigma-70 family)